MQTNDQNKVPPSAPQNGSPGRPMQSEGGLSPKASAIVTFLLGAIAVCLGVYWTSFIVGAGDYVARHSSNSLSGAGGAIWSTFGPILPYVLLGLVVAIMTRFSWKIRPVMVAALILSILTCVFHLYSPMLQWLGVETGAKGLVKSPGGFAVFYFVVGLIVMIVIWLKFGGHGKRTNQTPPKPRTSLQC